MGRPGFPARSPEGPSPGPLRMLCILLPIIDGVVDHHPYPTTGLARSASHWDSTQLAVLAASAIDSAQHRTRVPFSLAGHACPHPGNGAATPRRNFFAADVAFGATFAGRQAGTRRRHRVHDRRVDLILHGTIGCPSICHRCKLLNPGRTVPGQSNIGCFSLV